MVDDEKAQRDLLVAVLSPTCQVDTAASVAEALVKAELSPPALVIMDYAMPAASGIEGLLRLREFDAKLPVMILTGHADLAIARQAIQLGAIEYILKPFDPADLISAVLRATGAPERPEPAARKETPYSLQRRLAGSVDLWRSRLPTVTSANHLSATLDSGRTLEAKVLRLGPDSIQAEVYDPTIALEPGQTAPRLEIRVGGEPAYQGAGELRRVITTGPTAICEFFLTDGWAGTASVANEGPAGLAAELAEEFSGEWRRRPVLADSFKLAVAETAAFLSELRDWLAGVEAKHPGMAAEEDRGAIEELYARVAPLLNEVFGVFEREAAGVPEDKVGVYAEHVRTWLHPLLLCAPFVHRCFTKPLSYPGDFGVMNYMLGDPFQGSTLYAQITNAWVIRSGTCATYRSRVRHLETTLHAEATRLVALEGRPMRVLSLGCGAAPEVQSFLRHSARSAGAEFVLLDFNPTTVEYARNQIAAAMVEAARPATVTVREFSAQQMLAHGSRLLAGRTGGQEGFLVPGAYDLVYCAGLFDYLSDRVCQRLVEIFWALAAPGGAVVASNFSMPNPMRGFMDYVVDWRLIHRDEPSVRAMAPRQPDGRVETQLSPGGSEVFLHLRKSAAGPRERDAAPVGDSASWEGAPAWSGHARIQISKIN